MSTFRIEDGILWVGDRSFPWAEVRDTGGRSDWRRLGGHVKFESGWLLSVQFGSGNYCENRDTDMLGGDTFTETPEHAEIAMWDDANDGGLIDLWGDQVEGWCTPEFVCRVADLLAIGDVDGVLALKAEEEVS